LFIQYFFIADFTVMATHLTVLAQFWHMHFSLEPDVAVMFILMQMKIGQLKRDTWRLAQEGT
jgi:hypothetical protein